MDTEFISIGSNSYSSVSDSGVLKSGASIIAYGAAKYVALWVPHTTLRNMLLGHNSEVTTVRFSAAKDNDSIRLVSGDALGNIRIWKEISNNSDIPEFECIQEISDHSKSISCITLNSNSLATCSVDQTCKIYTITNTGVTFRQTLSFDNFYPLAIKLSEPTEFGCSFMFVGGSSKKLHVFASHGNEFKQSAILPGHEDWIKDIDVKFIGNIGWVASASQDKYIRIWKIERSSNDQLKGLENKLDDLKLEHKTYPITDGISNYQIWTFSIIIAHDDWVFTARWDPAPNSREILSASADNSITIFTPTTNDIWITRVRFGEMINTKGGTTATGSSGGFLGSIWDKVSSSIYSWTKTGGWVLWTYSLDNWVQDVAPTGHTNSVKDLSWNSNGQILLSTSLDQTTRLFAISKQDLSWHEFLRPQIHGYDLITIESLSDFNFASAAEEKIVRIFKMPQPFAYILEDKAEFQSQEAIQDLPSSATLPVLGLSNRSGDEGNISLEISTDIDTAPSELFLQKYSLFPEIEKLYGHGNNLSTISISTNKRYLATACKANTADDAVVRIYDTNDWHELNPPLSAHSLTVERMNFSFDSKYLLTVSRDRSFSISKIEDDKAIVILIEKGCHSRQIYDCDWLNSGYIFVTCSRDKTCKIWRFLPEENAVTCIAVIKHTNPVTSVAFRSIIMEHGKRELAMGTENGYVHVFFGDSDLTNWNLQMSKHVCNDIINQIIWQPVNSYMQVQRLAVASDDSSLHILRCR